MIEFRWISRARQAGRIPGGLATVAAGPAVRVSRLLCREPRNRQGRIDAGLRGGGDQDRQLGLPRCPLERRGGRRRIPGCPAQALSRGRRHEAAQDIPQAEPAADLQRPEQLRPQCLGHSGSCGHDAGTDRRAGKRGGVCLRHGARDRPRLGETLCEADVAENDAGSGPGHRGRCRRR